MKFKSSSIDWLVLSSASEAVLKGAGTVNGKGSYEVLAAVTNGGGSSKIRVKIVNKVPARPHLIVRRSALLTSIPNTARALSVT
jgi:hypothetical protein